MLWCSCLASAKTWLISHFKKVSFTSVTNVIVNGKDETQQQFRFAIITILLLVLAFDTLDLNCNIFYYNLNSGIKKSLVYFARI